MLGRRHRHGQRSLPVRVPQSRKAKLENLHRGLPRLVSGYCSAPFTGSYTRFVRVVVLDEAGEVVALASQVGLVMGASRTANEDSKEKARI
jgi:hypothetical protein